MSGTGAFASPATLLPDGKVAPIFCPGPAAIFDVPSATIDAPGTIAGSGTFTTDPIATGGMAHIAGSAELTQDGTLILGRYLDNAGSIAIGGTTVAMSAGTLALFDVNDGKIFQSFDLAVINDGTVAGTLTNVAIVLASA